MTFTYLIIDHDRGKTIQYNNDTERQSNMFFPAAMIDHSIMGSPIQALQNSLAIAGEIAQRKLTDLSVTGFRKLAEQLVDTNIKPHFVAAQRAIPTALQDVASRFRAFNRPRFSDDQSPAVRVEQRQYARSLSLSKVMELTRSDRDIASAIVEGGLAMSNLPADIYERLRRDMAIHNATRILSGQRNFQTAPNAADPVGGQPDEAAARLAGEQLIEALEREGDLINDARSVLSTVVTGIALLTDQTRDAAFAELTRDATA